ncbi:hypothetical protein Bbelb_298140 [Branchiostoma belcheri]|nr:hypothetical protein Bbelb_298140 [Branchiostoma belcheri]
MTEVFTCTTSGEGRGVFVKDVEWQVNLFVSRWHDHLCVKHAVPRWRECMEVKNERVKIPPRKTHNVRFGGGVLVCVPEGPVTYQGDKRTSDLNCDQKPFTHLCNLPLQARLPLSGNLDRRAKSFWLRKGNVPKQSVAQECWCVEAPCLRKDIPRGANFCALTDQ